MSKLSTEGDICDFSIVVSSKYESEFESRKLESNYLNRTEEMDVEQIIESIKNSEQELLSLIRSSLAKEH